jgi:hypothetical protein
MITRMTMGLVAGLAVATVVTAKDFTLHSFKRIQLSDKFYCEGIYYGDFNHDGKMDVVAGPFWYEGPDFAKRHEYRPVQSYDPKGYSDNFLTFAYDFNQDGWIDILRYDTPGQPAYWYENPHNSNGMWTARLAFAVVDNESPDFGDLNDDGRPEVICNSGGFFGYAQPDWSHPTNVWQFKAISPKGTWHKYTHGLGFGDINGDHRTDFVEIGGWWEQPPASTTASPWILHPDNFGEGGAQMLVYDFNGDGLNDILTCLQPHQYGLAWFQQTRENNQIKFKKHAFMGKQIEDNPYGLKITQLHAFALVDMDGDGVQDFVTGKRWWAHPPPTDPESDAPSVLYWFRTVRSADRQEVDFVPYLIDADSGVGTQVVAADVNGDKLPDVLVGNKKGIFVFLHETKNVSQAEWDQAQPKRREAAANK